MAGYDQKSNVVLSDSKERVYSMDEGVEEIPLGLYLVKGDQMCVILVHLSLLTAPVEDTSFFCFYGSSCVFGLILCYISVLIGELDEATDKAVDLSTIRAEPLPPIRY